MSSSPTPPALPRVGEIIGGGKYEVIRTIGEGGMGSVLEARHVLLRHTVAIKLLSPDLCAIEEIAVRFEREARASAALRSIHAARVQDVGVLESGVPYMVMELLTGNDFGDEIDSRVEAMPIEECVDYVTQACAAMAEAHELGTVHRDLKPSNMFLCNLGDWTPRKLVKVIDFGISKTIDDGKRVTATQAVFGTPDYMSPEQVRSTANVDGRSDIWSLGVILYEAVTGRTPFIGPATSKIASIVADPIPRPSLFRAIPEGLDDAIMKALEKDVSKRYQTAEEFADAIAPFGPPEPIAAVLARAPRNAAYIPQTSHTPPSGSVPLSPTKMGLVPQSSPQPVVTLGVEEDAPPSSVADSRRTPHPSWEKMPTNSFSNGPSKWLIAAALSLVAVGGTAAFVFMNRPTTATPVSSSSEVSPIPPASAIAPSVSAPSTLTAATTTPPATASVVELPSTNATPPRGNAGNAGTNVLVRPAATVTAAPSATATHGVAPVPVPVAPSTPSAEPKKKNPMHI